MERLTYVRIYAFFPWTAAHKSNLSRNMSGCSPSNTSKRLSNVKWWLLYPLMKKQVFLGRESRNRLYLNSDRKPNPATFHLQRLLPILAEFKSKCLVFANILKIMLRRGVGESLHFKKIFGKLWKFSNLTTKYPIMKILYSTLFFVFYHSLILSILNC